MVVAYHVKKDFSSRDAQKEIDFKVASVDELLSVASHVVADVGGDSKLFASANQGRIPKFSDKEIATGAILGRGGFCVVRNVDKVRLSKSSGSNMSAYSVTSADDNSTKPSMFCCRGGNDVVTGDESVNYSVASIDDSNNSGGKKGSLEYKYSREYVAAHAKSRRHGGRYVIKTVSKDLGKVSYMKGVVDIAMEAKFLSVLDHNNIINLAGVSKSDPCTHGYFLILEKMTETLGGRIKTWMDKDRMSKSCLSVFGGKTSELDLYLERIGVSYDVASALFYLHSKDIIFRDLKPANIGFDSKNVLKLFDFGLAKEMKDSECNEDGTYRNMTIKTGAIRYMAPEVGLGKDYNLSADVYSWSMLMWFILALEPPYGYYTEDMIMNRVHEKGHRPVVFRRWSSAIGELLKRTWDENLHNRPKMLDVVKALKQELVANEAGGTISGSTNGSENDDDRTGRTLPSRR
eukprot:Nitzschia sp. Nitz4//scaffold150_size53981//37766//39148//NITZ4_006682-RA/size53981-processed-gene-0.18-mRNA-1//1//CDS//3329537086//6862//frame0